MAVKLPKDQRILRMFCLFFRAAACKMLSKCIENQDGKGRLCFFLIKEIFQKMIAL